MTFEQARDYLLAKARQQGLEAEVVAEKSRELSLKVHGGKLEEITQATQGGVGLRVVTQGKVGYAYSEELSSEALDWVLAEAHENALLQTGSGGFLPSGAAMGSHDLLGEGLSAPIEQKRQAAFDLERHLYSDPRVKQIQMATYSENEVQSTLGSTAGASGDYRNGYSYLLSYGVMGEGQSLKQALELDVTKEFHALEPGKTALEFIQNTGRLLGAKPLKTGRYRAYFEPKAFSALLAVLSFMFSGKSVLEGKSPLAGKLGQKVASDVFTLVDDPTFEGGLATRPFDAEGTPAQRTPIIEKGLLKTFLHNSETAHKSAQPNTGHATRPYKGTLGVSTSNLMVQPGAGIRQSEGIIVADLMGVHAGANPISGDFSLQALGLKVEGGEVAYAVENFTVAGNLLELLQNISAVGDTLEWGVMMGVIATPMIEIAELSFAGA